MHQLFFLIVLILLYTIFIRKKIIDRFSRIVLDIFSFYWFLALFLSIVRIGDLIEVSDYTYFLMYISIVSFIFGYSRISVSYANSSINNEFFESKVNRIIKNKLFLGLLVFTCIYVYFTLIKFFNAIAYYGTLSNVRTDFFSGELYGPVFEQINAFILLPFSVISTPIFAYLLFYNRNLICILLGFFLFGYESLGGGRLGYIRIVLAVIFVLYILLDSYHTSRRRFLKFISVFALSIVMLLSVVTTLRLGNTDSKFDVKSSLSELADHLASYTASPIAAFDYSLKHHYIKRFGGYKKGNLTFSGFISLANLFTSRIGLNFPLELQHIVQTKQEDQIAIDNKHSTNYNALYTANFYFYYDLGLLGVVLFPFFFGVLFRHLILKLFQKNSYCLIAIVTCCFYPLIASVMDFFLVDPYLLLILIVLYVLGTINFKRVKFS